MWIEACVIDAALPCWRERVACVLFLIDGTCGMRTSILREIAQGLLN